MRASSNQGLDSKFSGALSRKREAPTTHFQPDGPHSASFPLCEIWALVLRSGMPARRTIAPARVSWLRFPSAHPPSPNCVLNLQLQNGDDKAPRIALGFAHLHSQLVIHLWELFFNRQALRCQRVQTVQLGEDFRWRVGTT